MCTRPGGACHCRERDWEWGWWWVSGGGVVLCLRCDVKLLAQVLELERSRG
jgi:hypothetical protein